VPAIRGVYTIHPQSGEVGLWLELSTSPVGTLTGFARAQWPSTAGKTLANYQAELNLLYRGLCSLPGQPMRVIVGMIPPEGFYFDGQSIVPTVCIVTITLSSLSPVTISNVTVSEGAVKVVRV
jgi:hypothetical protein